MVSGAARLDSGRTDPGGPVMVACVGHRCTGLHNLAASDAAESALHRLRATVRTSVTGLLITTGCMGPCHQGAVVGIGHRAPKAAGAPLVVRGMILFGGMQHDERAHALDIWFQQGGPLQAPMPTPILTEASLGPPPSPRDR